MSKAQFLRLTALTVLLGAAVSILLAEERLILRRATRNSCRGRTTENGVGFLASFVGRSLSANCAEGPGVNLVSSSDGPQAQSASRGSMAAVGTVLGQVHALARAQAHPNDFAESPLARAWGEPATRALRPLLDWSDPWTVYVTYGKIWFPVCLGFTAAAYLVYRRRAPAGGRTMAVAGSAGRLR